MSRLAALFFVLLPGLLFAQTGGLIPTSAMPKYEMPNVKYPTAEAFVISYNIMDFQGADNTGKTDQAPLIKKLLKKMEGSTADQGGVGNGGILFLPEGKYLLNSNITIPKGVTIRGEWQFPVKGKPIVGTILMTVSDRTEDRLRLSRCTFRLTSANHSALLRSGLSLFTN